MNNKCVYVHFCHNTPIYVGSGTLKRPYDKSGRSDEHLKYFNDQNFKVIILVNNLSYKASLELEQNILDEFLRKGHTLLNKNLKINSDLKDYSIVNDFVYYDESSPTKLKWLVDRRCGKGRIRTKSHSVAGSITKSGYPEISINGNKFTIHRIVWYLHNGKIDNEFVIDHIDRNKSNNSISNLRCVPRSINSKNKIHRGSNCGYQNISECIRNRDSCFLVSWQETKVSKKKSFYYGPKSRTRENALSEAVSFRNTLVLSGKILLT